MDRGFEYPYVEFGIPRERYREVEAREAAAAVVLGLAVPRWRRIRRRAAAPTGLSGAALSRSAAIIGGDRRPVAFDDAAEVSSPAFGGLRPGGCRPSRVSRRRRGSGSSSRLVLWALVVVFAEPWGRLWGTGQDARCY